MAVVDVGQAREWLGITTTEYDAKLEDVVAAAEAVIGQRCGPLESTLRTGEIVFPNWDQFTLPGPVVSVVSVTDPSGASINTADLLVDARAGVVTHVPGSLPASWYVVNYNQGRVSCPADLVQAVLELVRHLWNPQRGNKKGLPGSSASDGAANTIPGAAYLLPFRVSELIAPHLQAGVA